MNENENVGFEEFEKAMFGDDYQFEDEDGDFFEENDTDDTEDDDVTDESDDSEEDSEDDEAEATDDTEDEPDEAETKEDESEDGEGNHDDKSDGMTFTLKVNKEERQVGLEEMTALAQKGADYDRVKKQYTDSQQALSDLKSQYEVLDMVAEKFGKTPNELAELLYLSLRKNEGASEELAKEELKRTQVEKERDALKSQKAAQEEEKKDDAETRAQREIEAFKNDYPDVKLTDELLKQLTPDLQKGKSLSSAYRALEKAQSDAKIKELEQKLAAKEQNDKNKKRSPGSQKDSGGRRTKSDYDEFERALFG